MIPGVRQLREARAHDATGDFAVPGDNGSPLVDWDLDPRVALSVEGTQIEPPGLQEYLLVHGTARVTQGGGPQLLQELAHVYLGPDVKFPAFDNPPPGRIMHISIERIAGVGPWTRGA